MEYFRRQKCDIVVLEVGIGGLWDSTNVIEAKEAAVITSIGFDHTGMLGTTIQEIAAQKAGIIKENTDVIFQGKDMVARREIEKVCQRTHSRLVCPSYDTLIRNSFDLTGQTFDYKDYHDMKISLSGLYQLENAAIAITALEVLAKKGYAITREHIRNGLSKAVWIGRFQIIGTNPVVIVDGSHNPPGIEATAESLRGHFPNQKIVFLMGVMKDKEMERMSESILSLAKTILTVTPDNQRAMKAEDLAVFLNGKAESLRGTAKHMQAVKAEAFSSVEAACAEALKRAGTHGVVCALGSLYLVDEVERGYKSIRQKSHLLS